MPPSITVIPVLDLMQGQVVRAVRGQRSSYAPIVSRLVAGSNPVDVAGALLQLCRTRQLYVADLDGILHGRPQLAALQALYQALPGLTLWLDAGFSGAPAAQALRAALGAPPAALKPVFGSESLADAQALQAIAADPQAVLSLDTRQSQPMDPAGVWQRPEAWPDTVILMTLDRVGAGSGPDLGQFSQQRARRPQAQWVGAGGVRHAQDLQACAAAGAQAWLVASALHDGTLVPAP